MPPPVRALVADYRQRLNHFGGVDLREVAEARRTADTPAQREQDLRLEAHRIRVRWIQPSLLIPLDGTGRALSSPQLAETLEGWRRCAETVCFVIGGPDGLHPEIKEMASWSTFRKNKKIDQETYQQIKNVNRQR